MDVTRKSSKGGEGRRRITCLSGTPGTGKSTVANILRNRGLHVVEIENFARARGIYSYVEGGETLVIEIPELVNHLETYLAPRKEALIVGHLSHHLPGATAVVVLRTRPDELERRLVRKGWPKAKIEENVEAEALDILLSEALEMHGKRVSEIDTSSRRPEETADMVLDVHEGRRRYPPKGRDWLLEHILKRIRPK